MKALYWHKRDFRLIDNDVLRELEDGSTEFIPFYIWEDFLINTYQMSDMHKHVALQAITSTREHYKKYNVQLLEVAGDIISFLKVVKEVYNFDALYSHMEHGTTDTYERDKQVTKWCNANNIKHTQLAPSSVVRGLEMRKHREKYWHKYINSATNTINKLVTVSNNEYKNIENSLASFILAKENLYKNIIKSSSENNFDNMLAPVTEKNAHLTLRDFLKVRSLKYRGNISSPNTALIYGSRLSAHLAWGTISLRYIYRETNKIMAELKRSIDLGINTPSDKRQVQSLRGFLSRLHWRDHFIQRLETNSSMPWRALNPVFENIEYVQGAEKEKRLTAWLTGTTGEPLVDACMRCLRQTGFVNFRMRAMCVSYAYYALHIDWRDIGFTLGPMFYDYEPGIHWSQVQMQAGVVGINALRVYSPEKQMLDQDPECIFIKKHIPELKTFTSTEIHNYKKNKLGLYPALIVDFLASSKVMKKTMYDLKKSTENKIEKEMVLAKHGSTVFKKPFKKKEKSVTKNDTIQLKLLED